MTDKYFHDVPFDAHFASELAELQAVSSMPGVDGFTLRVDALYKVRTRRRRPRTSAPLPGAAQTPGAGL